MGGTINEQFPVGVTKTMVLEGQLRRVTAERDQLRAELAAAKEERDQLAAHVERLKGALGGAANRIESIMETEPHLHLADDLARYRFALAATPAQSLAAHDAAVKVAVLREVAETCKFRLNGGEWRICPETLLAEADRIAKEAPRG